MNQITNPRATEILGELGLTLDEQGPKINFYDAENCYIHHTRMPVALTGYALVSPTFARGRFPKTSIVDLVNKRPALDDGEAIALAALCGVHVCGPFWSNGGPFGEHLWDVIDRYDLGALFQRVPKWHTAAGAHYEMRPCGYDWDGDYSEVPEELTQWRSAYKKLPLARQLMAATILHLYNSTPQPWMLRAPKPPHATDAIIALRDGGLLQDWARLVALYPAW